jgi:twinkle protein
VLHHISNTGRFLVVHNLKMISSLKHKNIFKREDHFKFYSSSSSTTFVSNYYKVQESDIIDFVQRKGMIHKIVSSEIIIKDCPFCHDTKNNFSNLWKLYIHRHSGAYLCHRCGNKGSWYDFKNRLQFGDQLESNVIQKMENNLTKLQVAASKKLPKREDIERYQRAFIEYKYPDVNKYFAQRGISREIATKYKIGAEYFNFYVQGEKELSPENVSKVCITFPMDKPVQKPNSLLQYLKHQEAEQEDMQNSFQIVRHKIRAVDNKALQKLDPAGGQWGLFGLALVPLDAREIVVTEGEFDAMVVHQATGLPTVSLPNGCRSLPVDILPFLERFERIYLWMDDDIPGQEGAEQFASKLGIGRCFIVHSSTAKDRQLKKMPKDANEALLAGVDLKKCIEEAAPLNHSHILTFPSLKKEIFTELYGTGTAVTGIPSKFLPSLNKILKGHRRGEITIVTGPTGIGKTTIVTQMTLDYCTQGVTTLFGSFEIKNHRLIRKMMCQYAGKDLSNFKHEFEAYCDQFERLPLYFMNFYGSTNVDQVLDAMDYAVYVHDVQHIVIDNLQFMMSGQGVGFEKFEMQDKAIEKFRLFATQKNVHITIVIHPRKVEDGAALGISSVFGTAKVTQEADNVIIIQKGNYYRYLSIKKNRYDGATGIIPYRFDRDSNRIFELTDEQKRDAIEGKLVLQY